VHALGAGGAAAAFGALLGAAGGVLGAPWDGAGPLLVLAVAAAYALRELVGIPVPIPERRRQVPVWWRTFFPAPVAAFLYGAGLGIGFLTYLRHGTLVAVAAAAVTLGDPALGALVLLPFGVARALALVVVARTRTSSEVSAVTDRLERVATSAVPSAANAAALLVVGVAAALASDGAAGVPRMAAALLALTFAWAAGAKIVRWEAWRSSLEEHRLGALRSPVAALVPPLEAGVPLLVLLGRPAAAGVVTLVLLAAFSAALVRSSKDGTAPCACFGRARRRSLRALLLRNAGLTGVAGLSLAAGRSIGIPLSVPGAEEALPAVLTGLAVVGAGVAVVTARRWLRPTAAGRGTSPGSAGRPGTLGGTRAR
jgi:hypothetical protein